MEEVEVLFEGDTVRLKYGGPLMTVLAVTADRCCCFWFDEGNRLVHGEFDLDVVRFVEPATRLIPHAEPFWRRMGSRVAASLKAARTPSLRAASLPAR